MKRTRFMCLLGVMTLAAGCASQQPAPETLDRKQVELIQETVNLHLNDIRNCYESLLTQKKLSEARVWVGWAIKDELKATDISFRYEPTEAEPLASCVVDIFKKMQFPKDVLIVDGKPIKEGIRVTTYPFRFAPGKREQTGTYTRPKPAPTVDEPSQKDGRK